MKTQDFINEKKNAEANGHSLVLCSCPYPEEQAIQKYMLKKKCPSHFTPPLH